MGNFLGATEARLVTTERRDDHPSKRIIHLKKRREGQYLLAGWVLYISNQWSLAFVNDAVDEAGDSSAVALPH